MARPVLPTGQVPVLGRLEHLGRVRGGGLSARDVVVWLPPGYDDDRRRRYPVLYLFDGQNVFEPATSYIGVDWAVDEVATQLVDQGRIRPFVGVGIHSTERRIEELATPKHLTLLTEHVMPRVHDRYRVRAGRRHAAVMGSSLGGLAAFQALFHRTDLFFGAACLSPYFPPGTDDRIAASRWPRHRVRLYIDNGGDQLDLSFQPAIDQVLAVLRPRLGDDLAWHKARDAPHDETAWAARAWRPLEFLFGAQPPSASRSTLRSPR